MGRDSHVEQKAEHRNAAVLQVKAGNEGEVFQLIAD